MPEAAPPEILDQFRERFECWNDGELDLMQDMYAEDAEFDVSAVFTDVGPMRGHQNMRRYWDDLLGTGRRDVIVGFAGNDVIRGFAGNDLLCGGKGADSVYG